MSQGRRTDSSPLVLPCLACAGRSFSSSRRVRRAHPDGPDVVAPPAGVANEWRKRVTARTRQAGQGTCALRGTPTAKPSPARRSGTSGRASVSHTRPGPARTSASTRRVSALGGPRASPPGAASRNPESSLKRVGSFRRRTHLRFRLDRLAVGPGAATSNNEDGGTPTAFASRTMLTREGLRSPRSMPPTYVQCNSAFAASCSWESPSESRSSRSRLPNAGRGSATGKSSEVRGPRHNP